MPPQAKVLVVEDQESLRSSIDMILRHHGFAVVTAQNASEALEAIGAEHFDVVLTDLQMPGPGDGMAVIRAMHQKNTGAVMLLMSATLDPKGNYEPLQADELLGKPVRMQEVVQLIQAKLDLALASANVRVRSPL